jgi:hypothetical protein
MTDNPDWQVGDYVLDRNDRLWHAYSRHLGHLTWRGLGHADDWRTLSLQEDCGPLRRVRIVEVRK